MLPKILRKLFLHRGCQKVIPRLRESCRQVEADTVSNSNNKILPNLTMTLLVTPVHHTARHRVTFAFWMNFSPYTIMHATSSQLAPWFICTATFLRVLFLPLTLYFVPLEVWHGLHDGLDEGERVAAGDAHRRAHPAHRPAQVVVPVAPARRILEVCGGGAGR